MNTQKGRLLVAIAAIAVAISVPQISAQSLHLSGVVPFDFYIGEQLFPAGEYVIAPQTGNANAIRVYDNRGNSAFVMTMSLTQNRSINANRLVFRRYGTTNFLTGIYWQGYPAGRDLVASKTERQIAQNNSSPSTPVAVKLK